MDLKEYISQIPLRASVIPTIRPEIQYLLYLFTKHRFTNSYELSREFNPDDPEYENAAYKNVHKNVLRLRDQGLIEYYKVHRNPHKAEQFRLSSVGIFYILKNSMNRFRSNYLFENYWKDPLIKFLIHPYFEQITLTNMQSFLLIDTINTYLATSTNLIQNAARYRQNFRNLPAFRFMKFYLNDNMLISTLAANLNRVFFLEFILKYKEYLTYGDLGKILEQDMVLLGKDKKFIQTVQKITSNYEMVLSEFSYAISKASVSSI